MIAIFDNEKDAVTCSENVHTFLKENRPDYKADRWSTIEKSEKEDLWSVKIPSDFDRWGKKLQIDIDIISTARLVDKKPDGWVKEFDDEGNEIIEEKNYLIQLKKAQ